MELELKDKVVIVSGGAKGIGAAICLALANEGALPVVVGRNSADNEELVRIMGTGLAIRAELTNPADCKNAIEAVIKKFSRIDGLINNAGVNDGVGLASGDYDSFISSLHKNLVHYFLLAHHSLPELIKSKGSIVNIGSKVAETGQGNTSGYAAANGGRNALTREWAVELLPYGIRVNAVIVAESFTPLYEKWINSFPDPQGKLNSIIANIPLENRMTRPDEIADTVLFLLSSRSSHTTGQLIHVDGGYTHLDRAL
jgi:L-fucose dehydrogenase